jgi:TrmH family RNA methyltransferase
VIPVKISRYSKDAEYSFSLGAFPTIELLRSRPEHIISVYLHSKWNGDDTERVITSLCNRHNISIYEDDRVVERVRDKENCYVVGVFRKYSSEIKANANHIVLVNPGDMGNLGTILRTCLGFKHLNISIIKPCADIYNPKVIRASMGAIFHVNINLYDTFVQYRLSNPEHQVFPFMLNGEYDIERVAYDNNKYYSLIFGNEAKGLEDTFRREGKSVYIAHSDCIDSLNLPMAVGIGMYEFSRKSDRKINVS